MKLSTCLLQFFKFCDLFSLSHFLRYKGQSEYKTASGGVISLIVVCIFSALFLNVAIATINKSIINWNSQTTFSNDPTPTTINTSTSNFMFTVGLIGLNVNDPNVRYFDFNLYSRLNGQAGVVLKSDKVPLQPCRIQHFYMNQQIYSEMPASSWLCPPLNFSYQLYGKFMSNKMSYLIVEIAKCKPSSSDPRPCATDSTIDYMIQSYGPLNVAFFYTNPLINPGKADYLSYYLKAQNWVSFTKTLGAITVAYVQDFQINTDESLLPFTKNHVDAGVSIPDIFQTVTNQVTSDTYVSWVISKSSVQKTYTRSFNKVDQFFSYVGGLVGTILALMFFMANFTSMAFGLDLAQGIFRYKQKEDANFQNFNLLTYIAFIPYKIGKFFNRCKHWKEMKKREQCFDEVEKQLDISLILRKINFLERSVESMLGEEEYKLKHYSENECLAQVKARRRLYSINKKKQNGQQEHDESDSDESEQEGEGTVKDPDEMQNSNIHQHSFQKFKIHSQIHSQLGLADHFQNNKLDLGQKDPSYRNQQKRKLFKFNQATQLQLHNQLFFDNQEKQIAIDSANINPNGQIIKKGQQKNGQKFKQ